MTASLIMDPNPTVLHPSDRISTAIQYIMDNRYRHLPVVDDENRFLGAFGVNCLLSLVLPKAALMEKGLESASFVRETLSDLHRHLRAVQDQPVSLCLHEVATVVHPDTPLVETLLILYRTRHSLPVVEADSGRLVGAISYWDALHPILDAEI